MWVSGVAWCGRSIRQLRYGAGEMAGCLTIPDVTDLYTLIRVG